ncbi:hypothetical protein CPC08DRAFT_783847 [Agrocybe pediades]|nr:hypothetical protein CPC08DRAFT_783847 [Agrocybe pediades]
MYVWESVMHVRESGANRGAHDISVSGAFSHICASRMVKSHRSQMSRLGHLIGLAWRDTEHIFESFVIFGVLGIFPSKVQTSRFLDWWTTSQVASFPDAFENGKLSRGIEVERNVQKCESGGNLNGSDAQNRVLASLPKMEVTALLSARADMRKSAAYAYIVSSPNVWEYAMYVRESTAYVREFEYKYMVIGSMYI